jgi:hypothetical protein
MTLVKEPRKLERALTEAKRIVPARRKDATPVPLAPLGGDVANYETVLRETAKWIRDAELSDRSAVEQDEQRERALKALREAILESFERGPRKAGE